MRLRTAHLFLLTVVLSQAAHTQTVAELDSSLATLSIDPQESYRVRDLRLRKGDVSIYLNEGSLSFATPVGGRIVAAVFTTEGIDAGDAEFLLMPPQPAERASLASFAKTPNLDEHFSSAVFFFTDDTRRQILSQIIDPDNHRSPEIAAAIKVNADAVLRSNATQVNSRLLESLLSTPGSGDDFFWAVVGGHTIGSFSFMFDPTEAEPVVVGATRLSPGPVFQLWTSYRPRKMAPYVPPAPVISDYRIDAAIAPDLSLQATATFKWKAGPADGRGIHLNLSRKLQVQSATLNGEPVEFVHEYQPSFEGAQSDTDLLLVLPHPVTAGQQYGIAVRYRGFVIREVSPQSYFVSERNLWYPHVMPMYTTFDLIFHCPARFQLVSSGDLVTDKIDGDMRIVHRVTPQPEQLAGFNLGQYRSKSIDADNYHIECYSTESVDLDDTTIPQQSVEILRKYTAQWSRLPTDTLCITPIHGYFGQGFPGLIYLSESAYLRPSSRPADVRNARADTFFADVLLPHELAHQWWGNLIGSASYRSDWLMESMANYAALQLLEAKKGRGALDNLLEQYRRDLLVKRPAGETIESAGPVDFGVRLLNTQGTQTWQTIIYEKGTWILQMLRERLGTEGFHQMQLALLNRYTGKEITNEEFRETASAFVPPGQPDPKLTGFFETWVYGTGIPSIRQKRSSLNITDVDEAFTFDLPMTCSGGKTRWAHVTEGQNQLPPDMANCQLPQPQNFLYLANDSNP